MIGGTPALLINGVYLSFFHSIMNFYNCHHTYVIGAYMFTAKAPFQWLKISSFPIISNNFENSEENSFDITFPMNFWLETKTGLKIDNTQSLQSNIEYNIMLSAGRHNKYGIIMKIDYNTLINSLELLIC